MPHRHRDLPYYLHGIRVKNDLMLMCQIADLPDRFKRSDLIISIHDGNKRRIIPDGLTKPLHIHQTIRIHIQICHLISQFFQIFTRIKHRVMLNL